MKPVLVLSALLLLATAACSKSAPPEGALTNDLRLPGAPVGKAGVPDDGVKPMPTLVVGKAGTADDGVKPMPRPVVGRGGVPDDGVKPAGLTPPPPGTKR